VTINRRRAFIGLVVLQILFLVAIALNSYIIRAFGTPVVLKTAPVDPFDPMMGDYVRLNYEISDIPLALARDFSVTPFDTRRNRTVYVVLRPDGKYHTPAGVYRHPPKAKPGEAVIRGRLVYVAEQMHVEYGIEKFFVPQGSGRVLEQSRSLDVEVRILATRAQIIRILAGGKPVALTPS